MKQILVLNFGGLGDEILFLPTLKSLKTLYPNSYLTLVLEPRAQSIIELTSDIDEVKTFDIKKRPLLVKDLLDLLGLLRSKSYDIVISSGSSPLVAILLFLSGIAIRVGFNCNIVSNLLLTHKAKLNQNQYAGLMYYSLAQSLGAKPKQTLKPEIHLTNIDNQTIQDNNLTNKPFILIHPGTSKLSLKKGIIKTYDNWPALINNLIDEFQQYQIVLTGGPEDSDIILALQTQIKTSSNFKIIYNPQLRLKSFINLLNLSSLFICLDSAPMHIACGLNKKLIALFGPTDPLKLLPENTSFKAKPLTIKAAELTQEIKCFL